VSVPAPDDWTLPKLRVDRNGDWFDGDGQVTHPGILASLRESLRRDRDGYFIQTRVRIPVQVEDVPFVVERVEPGDEGLRAILNDGATTVVDAATLRIGPGDVPYCSVRGRQFEARLSRAAAFQLLRLADYDEQTGRGILRLGGRQYPLKRSE
jgi:hypothetical protein